MDVDVEKGGGGRTVVGNEMNQVEDSRRGVGTCGLGYTGFDFGVLMN